MRNKKIEAAKRLTAALVSDLDFEIYLDEHPNEQRALDRLIDDIEEHRLDGNRAIPQTPMRDDLKVKFKAA
jgi:hypothetical protein